MCDSSGSMFPTIQVGLLRRRFQLHKLLLVELASEAERWGYGPRGKAWGRSRWGGSLTVEEWLLTGVGTGVSNGKKSNILPNTMPAAYLILICGMPQMTGSCYDSDPREYV